MVAKTTRRRSVALEMVPVGVNPSGPGADGLDMSWLPCDVGVDGVTSLSFRMRRLAPPAKDDIRFEIRRKSEGAPMTTIEQADPRFTALGGRPGKIVAVHLAYASRADQRGRRPAHPSYFLKPSSSLAASGATIERPHGTELLAFEGEIALVIGTPARRVSIEDAWAHVAAITAANDFGLYDLRANEDRKSTRLN